MTPHQKIWGILVVMLALVSWNLVSDAHRDPCHRQHACPSDQGTYVCGALGHCAQWLDNPYCPAGQPRAASQPSITPPPSSTDPGDMVKVRRVIDGDTLTLETGEIVRLIGVDTSETKHPKTPVQRFGQEATAFTKRLVEGREVRLAYH
jgi:hypothetical protein